MPWNKNNKNYYEVLEFLDSLMPSIISPNSSCYLYYKLDAKLYSIVSKTKYSVEYISIK